MEDQASGFYERTLKYLKERGLDVSGKVVLLGGVGTLGSRILRNLARFNFKKIIVIDFDRVGPENVGYQCYHKDEVGKKKVEVIPQRFNELHPWTKIEGVYLEVPTPSGLWSDEAFERLRSLVASSDLIITSFDVLPPRGTMLLLSVKYGKKFIDAGLSSTRAYIKVLKDNYCPICDKLWYEKVAYYTNPNLAEITAALVSQAALFLLNNIDWPSEINVYLEDPWRPYSASDVRNEGCPLCADEVKRLEEPREFLDYLIKNAY